MGKNKLISSALLSLCLLGTTSSFAQWQIQNSGTSEDLNSIIFSDINTGWACGKEGVLRHTTDGTTWMMQSSGTSYDLNDISFQGQLLWIVGENGLIRHSIDGGTTWTTQTSNTFVELFAVSFFDASTGMAAGEGGVILKTVNGGTTWTISQAGTGGSGSGSEEEEAGIADIQMVSTTTAYVCGYGGYFAKTSDSGATWTLQTSGAVDDLEALSFPSASQGFVAYTEGKVRKTNGTGTFTEVYAPTSKDLSGIHFLTNSKGWIVGEEGRILLTNDAGVSWSTHNLATVEEDLKDVYFPSADIGYICGKDGVILKITNGQVAGINESVLSFSLAPNPAKDFIQINSTYKNLQYAISDLQGKLVKTGTESTVDISELKAGTYIITLELDGKTVSQQLIKE